MFDRYTEKARRVIFVARYEAANFSSSAILPEHILLGLLREDPQLFRRLSPPGELFMEIIRNEVAAALSPGPEKVNASVDMPLSQSAKRVLQFAVEESERLHNRHIGTEHLLLGLLREETSTASRILNERGLSAEKVAELIAGGDLPSLPYKRKEIHALIDTLVRQEVLSPQDLIEEVAARYSLPTQALSQFHSLLDLLVRKGVISEGERREIIDSDQ